MTDTNPDRAHVGVDIGGTTITAGLFESGERSPAKTSEWALADLATPGDWIDALLDRWPRASDCSWGLGVPSPVKQGREVAETPNLPPAWGGTSISKALENRSIAFRMENDANLAALGEWAYGVGGEVDNLILLTLGTGIGGGIIVNGDLMRGATGGGSEIGHMTLEPGGRLCGCGATGCFERYGSASGLEITYEQLTGQTLSARDIVGSAERDPLADEAVTMTGLYLGRGLAELVNLFEPELFVFSGGLSRGLDRLKPSIDHARRLHTFANRARDIPMKRAQLDNPALLGSRVLLETSAPAEC